MEVQSLEYRAKNIVMEKLIKLIEKYPNKDWNWNSISMNPNLTMKIIEKYPDKPWDWCEISKKLNITIEIIESYPTKPGIGILFHIIQI